jgi:hypothetical protein
MKMKVGVAGKILTRQQIANPFHEEKMFDRLKNAKSVDLRQNFRTEKLQNGYEKITPIDQHKTF